MSSSTCNIMVHDAPQQLSCPASIQECSSVQMHQRLSLHNGGSNQQKQCAALQTNLGSEDNLHLTP